VPDWEAWITEQVGPVRSGRRVLVLCRTRASLSLVRRWAARRGGVVGLEAVTPASLAQQVRQEPVLGAGRHRRWPEDLVPLHTRIGARIGARPGLAAYARRWVQHARGAAGVGAALDVPEWLQELVDEGWGREEEEEAIEALIQAARARGRKLGASASWDKVLPIGFDRPHEVLAPWEPLLVRALSGRSLVPPAPAPERTIDAVFVPDVVAEARLAAVLARQDPDGTMILVSETATARRVRDALARNGIACAWRDSDALEVHTLASAVRRCAAWFGETPRMSSGAPPGLSSGGPTADPPVQVGDLSFVLGVTALQRPLHPAAERARRVLLERVGLEAEAPVGRRGMIDALDASRLLDAPLSTWQVRMADLVAELAIPKPGAARASAAIAVRLALLAACLAGAPFEDGLRQLTGEALEFDEDDFEDVLATLLGDDLPQAELPRGDQLGAVKRFLVACRPRVRDDPVACAILAALRHRADWPVTPSHVHQALSGSLDLGVLSDGVDVVAVDDWDGRPCRLLLLLGVHDHGLTRRAPPDPLLTDGEIAGLGALSGRVAVDERLAQVHRASAQAERVLAVVTGRDSGGREVVPPIQLALRAVSIRGGTEDGPLVVEPAATGRPSVPSYGFELPGLPERAAVALEPVSSFGGEVPLDPPEHDDEEVLHLAVQATAEWSREGRGPADALGQPPGWLAAYLGVAEPCAEARLPPDQHSVTGLLRPLTHCPYQAFARAVLRVGEKREVSQELEPREVGNAVHDALERVGDVVWRLEPRERDARAPELVSRLTAATTEAFQRAIGKLGPLSTARRASAEGRRDRWNAHWPQYVTSRTLAPAASEDRLLEDHPAVRDAVAAFRRAVPAGARLPERIVRAWVCWAAGQGPRALSSMAPEILLRDGDRGALPPSCLPDLPALAGDADLLALHQVISGMRLKIELWRSAPVASLAEVGFGEQERPPLPEEGVLERVELGPVALRLGAEPLGVRGRIDRIDVLQSPRGERFAAVVDYKTGRAKEPWRFRREQHQLRDPQLLLYAMVVAVTGRDRQLPEALRGVRVAVVAEDYVTQVVQDPEAGGGQQPISSETWIPVDGTLLRWAARELGSRLDDARAARWPLRPRADTCPMLQSYGHDRCPLAGACRLRALPAPPAEEPG
jgi:RecB family exonuclease